MLEDIGTFQQNFRRWTGFHLQPHQIVPSVPKTLLEEWQPWPAVSYPWFNYCKNVPPLQGKVWMWREKTSQWLKIFNEEFNLSIGMYLYLLSSSFFHSHLHLYLTFTFPFLPSPVTVPLTSLPHFHFPLPPLPLLLFLSYILISLSLSPPTPVTLSFKFSLFFMFYTTSPRSDTCKVCDSYI